MHGIGFCHAEWHCPNITNTSLAHIIDDVAASWIFDFWCWLFDHNGFNHSSKCRSQIETDKTDSTSNTIVCWQLCLRLHVHQPWKSGKVIASNYPVHSGWDEQGNPISTCEPRWRTCISTRVHIFWRRCLKISAKFTYTFMNHFTFLLTPNFIQ